MMMRNYVRFLLCAGALFAPIALGAATQKRTIDTDWEFRRLTDATSAKAIRNQGTDWASQYNIEHVQSTQSVLAVPDDTLRAEFARLNRAEWEQVDLPHTPAVEPLTILHQWQGICYYRKQLAVTAEEAAGLLWLEFEGAMQLADVWVNGNHLFQHAGGYTPFIIDVTGILKAGSDNEILVRLDNRDNPLIPPGKPLDALDFCYYGGIYRDVNLIAKPRLHITNPILTGEASGGIFVTYPQVAADKATVNVKTEVNNSTPAGVESTVRHTLYEWKAGKGRGRKVAQTAAGATLPTGKSHSFDQTLVVENPHLWYPDAPDLYILVTDLLSDGRVIDSEETRIGIRRVEMTRERGFVINGKPYKLIGTNRHQEYPYVGNAIPDRAQYRDMYHIRSNGFNIVRLGHYLQDVTVLDACDELGLLAIEPIPGWQFYNNDSTFIALTHRDVRNLIRRDRNHPSIIMWETTLNESFPPDEWKDGVIKIAHEEYPGDQCFTSGDTYGYDGFDVCYNDWENGFHRPNNTTKPAFIREFYDYEFGGHHSTTRIRRGDGEKAQLQNWWNAQWSLNRYIADYPTTMGGAVWSMYDYNRGYADNICYSGTADVFRLPKFSLHFFRCQIPHGSRLPEGKMPYELFIPSYRADEMGDTLTVFGNVEEVSLKLNGRTLGRRSADDGPDSEYKRHADGGNARHLAFPPFTFAGVPQERGELVAEGYVGGKKVASFTVRSPGEVDKLEITYFESGKPAARRDLLIVHVRLLDKNGTLCPLNGIPVTLSVEDGGRIVGPAQYDSECGVASFLVQTADAPRLKLKAMAGSRGRERTLKLAGDRL